MINPPKIEYRQDIQVFQINPNNLMNAKTFNELEEAFYILMQQLKRESSIYSRVSSFIFYMDLSVGYWITWDYLIDLLEYLDLSIQDIENFILFCKKTKTWNINKISCEWYLKLKVQHIKGLR